MRGDADRLIVWPNSGFANRLKCLVSASLLDEEYQVYWPPENFCGLRFGDIFADTWREIDHIPADSTLLNTWRFELPAELRSLLPPHFSDCSTGYKGIDFPGDSESRTVDFEYLRIPQPILMALRARFAQLRFTPEITERVRAILARILGPFVGVHARTWTDEPERRQKWFCFDDFARACAPLQKQNLVVASDDPVFISSLAQVLNRELITMPWSGQRTPKPWQQNSRDEMLDDIVELLVLANASQLVLTAMSTYSEVAWFIGGCREEVYFADPAFQHKGFNGGCLQTVRFKRVETREKVHWIEVAGNPSYYLALIPGRHVHLDHLGEGVQRIGDYVEKYSGYMEGSAPEDYMIDVGANLGLSAFPVASMPRRVVAFEPVADNVQAMKKSIARNRFDNVTLIEAAVSSQVGETYIYVPQGRADNTSFGRDVANANVSSPEVSQFLVPTETVDHWFEKHGKEFKPDNARLLKIDVQGYETAVLAGAKDFIAACRPFEKLIIEFEFDPKLTNMAGYSTLGLLELFNSYGLEIYCNGTQIPSDYYADFCKQDINCDLIALFRSTASLDGNYTGMINMGSSFYGKDFYNGQIIGSLQSAQVYLYHLFSIWGVPESVADLGCGRGAWLATCLDMGAKRVVGFDGAWNSQGDMLDQSIEFFPTDLEKSLSRTDSFDLAISLEVAEHLQPESSDTFVESLSSLSDALLFGAAFTGQPGANHINTRPHSFWAGKFFDRGYALFDVFRPTFWNDERVEPCYRQNTFVYVKPGHSLYQALINGGYEPDREGRMIDCVHPAVYIGLVKEYNKLQQSLTADQTESSLQDISDSGDVKGIGPNKSGTIKQLIEDAEAQITLSRHGEAADIYRQALALEPNNPEILLRLSRVLLMMKSYEEALHHARYFLRLVDDVAFGYFLAGHAARETGRWREAREYLLRAVELDPSNVYARVLCCMSVFTVCMDEAEAVSIMGAYTDELNRLIGDIVPGTDAQVSNAVEGIGALTPFFLPYLGFDVKNLQKRYGSWICSIMAAKYPQFTKQIPQQPLNKKIKIGIISSYFHNHSNWKIPIKGWLEQLDRQLFSIHCIHTGDTDDLATESARSLADSFVRSKDIDALAANLFEEKFDVLIYPGLGMDTDTIRLAALRLAPIQCTSWGHPVTTGMPTVDYFLSSDLMESIDGEKHYTEKLIRLPNLSVWYEPNPEIVSSNMVIPGVEKHDILFLCSQNLLKYLPQHDFIFPAIAGQVENVRFVFIASLVSELTDKFIQRLELAFLSQGLKAADYVSILPQLNEADFSALNAKVDIFLDSIEWSGCNTVFESLPFSKPIVTLPGAFMRGRHAYGILKMMGVEETIATDVEDYIAIAVRLARDEKWRDDISSKILRNKHKIYRDRECIKGLEKFLTSASGRDCINFAVRNFVGAN